MKKILTEEEKKIRKEKAIKGLTITGKVLSALFSIAGMIVCVLVIYAFVKSSMSFFDVFRHIFG